MEKYLKLYNLMNRIAQYQGINISQKDSLEFEIRVGGPLMESFERLGDIQEEIKKEIGNEFSLKTVYGDGQDALLIFTEI